MTDIEMLNDKRMRYLENSIRTLGPTLYTSDLNRLVAIIEKIKEDRKAPVAGLECAEFSFDRD
jgi:hypothetical protein